MRVGMQQCHDRWADKDDWSTARATLRELVVVRWDMSGDGESGKRTSSRWPAKAFR